MMSRLAQRIRSAEGPLAFAGLVALIELAQMLVGFRGLPGEFRSTVLHEWYGIFLQLAGFALRLLLTYLFLAAALWGLEAAFRVRRRVALYFLVTLYALAYGLLFYPQLFDDFRPIFPFVRWLLIHLEPWMIYGLAAAILAFLVSELARSGRIGIARGVICAALLGCLGYYFFVVQTFSGAGYRAPPARERTAAAAQPGKRKNVIILTIDSLRPDHPIVDRSDPGQKNLARLLDRSYTFKRVISSVAQTHPAFTSLFTAANPLNHGVRYLLSHRALDTDRLLENTPVAAFRSAGYNVTFMSDSNNYAFFNEGKVISRSLGAQKGIKSLILPFFFQSRVFYGLFNNAIGFFFLPELRSNAAFSTAYKLSYFTEDVRERLKETSLGSEPFLFVAHTCALHFPGHLTYPYYPPEGFDTGAPYAYATRSYRLAQEYLGMWGDRVDFHKKLYEAGVRQVRDQFLLPILEQLAESGDLENSVVIVMSDHGENLWSKDHLLEIKFPEHGSSLLFGADSELSAVSLYLPGLPGGTVPETIGHMDLLPTVADYLGLQVPQRDGRSVLPVLEGRRPPKERPYYTETSAWHLRTFSGQFRSITEGAFFSLFKMDRRSGIVYVSPSEERRIMAQKQRALYLDEYKLVLFPTIHGYRTFLCHVASDPSCTQDRRLKNPEVYKDLLGWLLDISKGDVEQGYLPRFLPEAVPSHGLRTEEQPNLLPKVVSDLNAHEWPLFQRALELIYRFHDYNRGTEILAWLLDRKDLSSAIRTSAEVALLDACTAGVFHKRSLPRHVARIVEERIDEAATSSAKLAGLLSCANYSRDERLRSHIMSRMQDLARTNVDAVLTLDWLSNRNSFERLKIHLAKVDPQSRTAFRILGMLQSYAPAPAKQAYENLWRRHPAYPSASQAEALEDSLREQSYERMLATARQAMGYAWSYRLPEELSRGYQKIFAKLAQSDVPAAVFEATRALTEEELSLEFSFELLRFMDWAAPMPKAMGITHSRLHSLAWNRDSGAYDKDVRAIESSLAAVTAETYLCGAKSRHCSAAAALSAGNPIAAQWKSLLAIAKETSAPKRRAAAGRFANDARVPQLIRLAARQLSDTSERR